MYDIYTHTTTEFTIDDDELGISDCSKKSSVRLKYPGMMPPGRTSEHKRPPSPRT